MGLIVPNHYLLTAGAGDAKSSLNAFDRALICAGIGNFNIVKVTSIMPPGVRKGTVAELPLGGIVYAALGSHTSSEAGQLISAAVAVGFPTDDTSSGVIMEGHFELSAEEAEQQVREMAEIALLDRGLKIAKIESIAYEHRVKNIGSVIAAVLLWESL